MWLVQSPLTCSYPESWPRQYPGHNEYWHRLTLNDHLATDVMKTLFLAYDVYGDERFYHAAVDLADFLLLAQMPDPQPAWAQQYSFEMQPIWARKFEPPAISGSESQSVISTLIEVFRRTADRRYIQTLPAAMDYLDRSQLPDGQLARFYELQSNRPLFFDRQYQLTYDDSDMPTHYGFKVKNKIPALRAEYESVRSLSKSELAASQSDSRAQVPSPRTIQQIIEAQDQRGAWVVQGALRFHKNDGPAIPMQLTVRNLNLIASYLADQRL